MVIFDLHFLVLPDFLGVGMGDHLLRLNGLAWADLGFDRWEVHGLLAGVAILVG